MTEPQPTDVAADSAIEPVVEAVTAEREDPADLSLRDAMARAMKAQGKVDPEAVFEEAEHVDLDDDRYWAHEMRDEDPGPDIPPPDPEQEAMALDDEQRSYTWEP